MKKVFLGISIAVVLIFAAVVPAFAEEGTVQGTVQTIDPLLCTFTILTSEGETINVSLPEGTDCSTLLIGDNVEVTGTLNEDGSFSATGVVVLLPVEEEPVNTGFYCSTEGAVHPALGRLAEAYAADYATLLTMFCGGGLGVGGVGHTLNTSTEFGVTNEEVLALRETMGWGRVWKTLQAAADAAAAGGETLTTSDDSGHGNGHGNGNNGNNGGGNGHGHGKNK